VKRRGLFITIEGIDGTGKSTQSRLIAEWLRRRGYKPLVTREPGGTQVGEQIREILLSSKNRELTAFAELLLMYAARRQHLEQIVRPALRRGEVVLSDRFNDASFAYQGYGRHLGEAPVRMLDRLICGGIQPDLTLVLDAPARMALARTSKRDARGRHQRFESQGVRFHETVRQAYLKIAKRNPGRVKVIRAVGSVEEVQNQIRDVVSAFLGQRAHSSEPSNLRTRRLENRKSKLEPGNQEFDV
jgi:dTMP kinase